VKAGPGALQWGLLRALLYLAVGIAALPVADASEPAGTLEIDVLPSVVGKRFEILIGHPVVGKFDQVPDSVDVVYTDTSVVVVSSFTPTLISLAGVAAEPTRVRLTWYASSPASPSAEVQRSTPPGGWSTIGQVSIDGRGQFEFIDSGVVGGARYGYRLEFRSGDQVEWLGETWVDVPSRARFGIAGASPNPATGDLKIAFSLPDYAPARLALLDVAGRLVFSREVGGLGPGNHLVNMAPTGALKPGVYLAQLSSGSRVAKARLVVTR